MVDFEMFHQCISEIVCCYSDLVDMLQYAGSDDKEAMLQESKQRCGELKEKVLSAEGEIFGKSKKALLFHEYMMYHMLICIIEGRKDYIEVLPIEFRGLIIHYSRSNPLGLYRLIINSKLFGDVYFVMDILCPIGDKSKYHSLLRVQYNFENYYAKYFEKEEFEKSGEKLNDMELELREMNMEMGDMSAKFGARTQIDRENAIEMIVSAIEYYEEREKIS